MTEQVGGSSDEASDEATDDADFPRPSFDAGFRGDAGFRRDAAIDANLPRRDAATRDAASSDGGVRSGESRLPLPCDAPLPTGFCMVSDSGDYIGQGRTYEGSGAASVQLSSGLGGLAGQITDDDGSTSYHFNFVPKTGSTLAVGLYDPATRYPFNTASASGLDVSGDGRGCNTITGKFSIEELGTDPSAGLARFSVIFEQHCEDGGPALRGVINYQARGVSDPTPTAAQAIAINGKVFRLAYDATAHVAYGLDATNRKLARIDLASGQVTYVSVTQVPNDACVDRTRGRLFVVNKGSSIVSEYKLDDLTLARELSWTGMDYDRTMTHFHIYCAPQRLYLVDGAWAPALFTIDGLDTPTPVTTDQTAKVSSIGGAVLNTSASDLYVWEQSGWSAGTLSTSVRRFASSDLSMLDHTTLGYESFSRDPLDAPILLDETRNLIFNKNRIFDATNLLRVVFTLPGKSDTFNGAGENAFALDSARGLLATRNFVYSLDDYQVVTSTLTATADQMFFDRDGLLWFLRVSDGGLQAQQITH